MRSDPSLLRKLNAGALAGIAFNSTNPVEKALVEQEVRRREAWAAPAGRSFWLSIAALAVSIGALAVAIFKP